MSETTFNKPGYSPSGKTRKKRTPQTPPAPDNLQPDNQETLRVKGADLISDRRLQGQKYTADRGYQGKVDTARVAGAIACNKNRSKVELPSIGKPSAPAEQ